jgi:hypothetical protein
LNKLFGIKKDTARTENDLLLCEIGDTYACIASFQPDTKQINGLDYYTFPPQQMADSIRQIFETDHVDATLNKVVCSGFAEAVLVPFPLYNDQSVKSFFMDTAHCQVLEDKIAEWQIINAYLLPSSVYGLLNNGSTHFFHTYTPTLKVYNGFVAENQVSINFSPKQFRVLVKKEGKLQLAQTYSYTVPLDVVYYILSIYQQFNLSKEETFLLLSGLIEEESALYKELKSYFLNLHFHEAQESTVLAEGYPQHYFTSLFNLAACAL